MALYRYLHPIENTSIDPSLSQSVPPSMLTSISMEAKKAEALPKKCGTYLTVAAKEKARVATYGSVNGARAAAKHFSNNCHSKCVCAVTTFALARQFFSDAGLPNIFIQVISSHTRLRTKTLHCKMQKWERVDPHVLRGQSSYDIIWVSSFGSHEI